ncbi:LOW QUALITY PROTEIN: cilia- and flagella-associated protein 299 [Hippocampus zosterae]|uniref:LOW QUALITY PROTEIN: cilia- and flagella-associated protein 299 n=1 Tax=Hippocampus zosterae TaxID=109293 RepID=UPI00223DEA8B|nr:LOW QUALITY PROTEIN: cilia- and flagella-associated protein 299 [Hippocampus zosterae]
MESNTSDHFQKPVSSFKDYEEYLDSKVTPMDLLFLTRKESARKLVEHGHKGTVLSRQEFEQRKAASASATRDHRKRTTTLASSGCDIRDNFLKELAQREEANRAGKMTSLIFIRDVNAAGQEVSGYIDYAHRLQMQDFAPYFSGRKKLVPGPRDLCYYNWSTQATASTSSSNYDVVYDRPRALLFKRKTDGGVLDVDPRVRPGRGVRRSAVQSDLYEHVVILDHDSTRARV